jgi:hypothetical protein
VKEAVQNKSRKGRNSGRSGERTRWKDGNGGRKKRPSQWRFISKTEMALWQSGASFRVLGIGTLNQRVCKVQEAEATRRAIITRSQKSKVKSRYVGQTVTQPCLDHSFEGTKFLKDARQFWPAKHKVRPTEHKLNLAKTTYWSILKLML